MDLTEIEWKKTRSCDICEKTGFVREIDDNEGNVFIEVCFYGCTDLRNIPTPNNSACDYCHENKGTEEVCSLTGYYCVRCKNELDPLVEEAKKEEIKSKKQWEKERQEYYENEADLDEHAKRFFDDYYSEPEDNEIVEIFVDIPDHYSSHVKYLKAKYEFKSRENTLEKGSYLIINE